MRFCRTAGGRLGRLAGEAEFDGWRAWAAGTRGALRAELVALDGDGGALLVAADDAAVDHELHGAGVVEQHGPVHGQLDGHPGGEHVLGA